MKPTASPYVVSFEAERFYRHCRYHWMVCAAGKPDELVSWGRAPTQALAETAARHEVVNLFSGQSQGGRVTNARKPSDDRK